MRISDWSSDVCSSDLQGLVDLPDMLVGQPLDLLGVELVVVLADLAVLLHPLQDVHAVAPDVADRDPCLLGVLARDLLKLAGKYAEQERRSEEHTSELQSLMRISSAGF